MENIKKCPWCGCNAIVHPSALGYFVECERNGHIHNIGCFGLNMLFSKSKEESIKKWNNCINSIKAV